MEGTGRHRDRKIMRQRKSFKETEEEGSTQVPSERTARIQFNLNGVGSELEFKKFERLIGDSLERVQNLRKGARTGRQPSHSSQQRKDTDDYYFPHHKAKKQLKCPDPRSPKASLLSSADTQLTDSQPSCEQRPRYSTNSELTIQYLLNQNKHLKEQIEMILKSRSKLNETEHLVKTISEYRRVINDQEAEIGLLKKYHLTLIKQGEKVKMELAAKDTKIQVLRLELEKLKSQSGVESQQSKIRHMIEKEIPLRMDEVVNVMDKIRQYFRRNQSIQDLVNCLERQIFWSSKEPGAVSVIPQSPRLAK